MGAYPGCNVKSIRICELRRTQIGGARTEADEFLRRIISSVVRLADRRRGRREHREYELLEIERAEFGLLKEVLHESRFGVAEAIFSEEI